MMEFIKKLFDPGIEESNDETVTRYIHNIDDLDEFLHERTLEHMDAEKNGTDVRSIKIRLNKDIYDIGEQNLFELLMMKSMNRALNDITLRDCDPRPLTDNEKKIEKKIKIWSLFNDETSTHH